MIRISCLGVKQKLSYLLYYTVYSHNNNYVVSIVELCSTTDVRGKDNWTPLHWACWKGSKDLVQYLVEELKMDVGEI